LADGKGHSVPIGKINPHHPILNGKRPAVPNIITAITNQIIANPHEMSPKVTEKM
jgi:hypothetical protein